MMERLGRLSKTAKLMLLVGLAVLAPVVAYAAYHLGVLLGAVSFG